jgi:hypothetical protein
VFEGLSNLGFSYVRDSLLSGLGNLAFSYCKV